MHSSAQHQLHPTRVEQLLAEARQRRVLVVGDVMLDQFIWGHVARISPEAPVPVVEFERESFMPGGAANVARNLTALGVATEVFGLIGRDDGGRRLKELLAEQKVACTGLIAHGQRLTSIKTRIVAHQQQVVRVDRESRNPCDQSTARRLVQLLKDRIGEADAVIVGDYGKGVVSQELLDALKTMGRTHGTWLSVDPKPIHPLTLTGLSLLTPNRKETFELAGIVDLSRHSNPLEDPNLLRAGKKLLSDLRPALLLVTLGDQGMLLFQHNHEPFHVPTVAQEVYDVSGAGDTVIATFTLAIIAGASPVEAAVISNHAAGVVVGKIGTATVHADELVRSFAGSSL